jgi:hypothetical protein
MTEYEKQGKDFLTSCNATMEIDFVGIDINQNWNDNTKRAKYRVTIKTPRGSMMFDFWDSEMNTKMKEMSFENFCIKRYGCYPQDLGTYLHPSRSKVTQEWKDGKNASPSEYSILACLTKYDPGTMHDFFDEMGYEIESADDIFSFMNTYNAVVKEYRDLCRIFTEEQMEALREIY